MVREIRFSSPLVTVSDVDVTPDLKQAHVFISAMGTPGQRREAIETLEHHRAALQHELSKRVILKHTPHLNFKLDESIERGSRVITIMDELGLGPRNSDEKEPEGE